MHYMCTQVKKIFMWIQKPSFCKFWQIANNVLKFKSVKLDNITISSKMVKKFISTLDNSETSGNDNIPVR